MENPTFQFLVPKLWVVLQWKRALSLTSSQEKKPQSNIYFITIWSENSVNNFCLTLDKLINSLILPPLLTTKGKPVTLLLFTFCFLIISFPFVIWCESPIGVFFVLSVMKKSNNALTVFCLAASPPAWPLAARGRWSPLRPLFSGKNTGLLSFLHPKPHQRNSHFASVWFGLLTFSQEMFGTARTKSTEMMKGGAAAARHKPLATGGDVFLCLGWTERGAWAVSGYESLAMCTRSQTLLYLRVLTAD